MYTQFFKLNKAPFKLTPDTECFFAEGSRKAILEGLIYTVTNGDGITKVIGEVGSGKTLLSRLLAELLPGHFEVLYLINPRISADKILYAIAVELGMDARADEDKVALLHRVQQRLLALHQQNKKTVLLIDEAQVVPLETLEEIRMLSNIETGQHKLLQIVLFGQPELEKKLKKYEVRQIRERIIHSFHLPRLTRPEVGRYLFFRLQKAGFQGVFPFSSLAVGLITMNSGGYLRKLNILADKCLLTAYSRQSRKVGVSTVWRVINEGRGHTAKFASALTGILMIAGLSMPDVNAWVSKQILEDSVGMSPTNIAKQEIEQGDETSLVTHVNQITASMPTAALTAEDEESLAVAHAYVIKLMQVQVKDGLDIHQAIRALIPSGLHNEVFFYPLKNNLFQVFLGNYLHYQEALSMKLQLPERLTHNRPYIQKKEKNRLENNNLIQKLKSMG